MGCKNLGTPPVPELVTDLDQFLVDHRHELFGASQYLQQIINLIYYFIVFFNYFFLLEACQSVQPHVQNSLCLTF